MNILEPGAEPVVPSDVSKESSAPPTMAKDFAAPFGSLIRKLRLARGESLRSFAEKVDFSATYLSKVERGEFSPPGEEKIFALAKELEQDSDELLAVAGRIASDLSPIMRRHAQEYAALIRASRELSAEQLDELVTECTKLSEKSAQSSG